MLNLLNFRFLFVYMHVLLLLEKKKERELTELVRVKGISSSKTFSFAWVGYFLYGTVY